MHPTLDRQLVADHHDRLRRLRGVPAAPVVEAARPPRATVASAVSVPVGLLLIRVGRRLAGPAPRIRRLA